MSEKIIIGIADAITGQNETKELTGQELTDFLDERKKYNDEKTQLEEKTEIDKEALFAKLGITADEAKLLLS